MYTDRHAMYTHNLTYNCTGNAYVAAHCYNAYNFQTIHTHIAVNNTGHLGLCVNSTQTKRLQESEATESYL